MPLYKRGGSGLPQGGAPGQVLGKTENGEAVWVDPGGKSLFRGEWGPDSLVYSYGFTGGITGAYSGSRSGVNSGSRDDLPVVVSTPALGGVTPASTVAALMRVRNYNNTTWSQLALDLTQLAIPNISRVRFKQAAVMTPESFTNAMGAGVRKNSVEVISRSIEPDLAWEYAELTAQSTDVISWRGFGKMVTNSQANLYYYVTDVEVYATDDPYMIGQFVTHQGRMYKSVTNNNVTTPGVGAEWVEAITLPSPTGTTAQRPSPGAAGTGFDYFDTTLNKPIWVNATATGWVDATGATV